MKILQTISSIDVNLGGPSQSVTNLAKALDSLNLKTSIFSKETKNPTKVDNKNIELIFCKANQIKKSLSSYLKQTSPQIIHTHGIWLPINTISAQLALKFNIPYIISPRGMLEPWSMKQGRLKKLIAFHLFQKRDLQKASCIHATAPMEAENIRALGIRNPIAVIPNGIDIAEFPFQQDIQQKPTKTLLFLSRIHPKKGIEILIEAWKTLPVPLKKGWSVEIAGNGEEEYIQSLQHKIKQCGIDGNFKIIGPQFDDNKLSTYRRADLFVLPTHSENFGIVVAEALACGVPVITTNGTPWQELNTTQSGWCIDLSIKELTKTLEQALQLSNEERIKMGQNGRKLIEDNYSIESVTLKMKKLYEWILNKTDRPDFVYLD